MKTRYTLQDIARLVGVTPSTVSRVLNGSDNRIKVSEATREKIHRVIEEVGYCGNINAKRLWSKHTNNIGVVVPVLRDRMNRYMFSDLTFMEAMCGIEEVLLEGRYHLSIFFQDARFIADKTYLQLYRSKMVDGVIIWGLSDSDDYIREMEGLPFVAINSKPEGMNNFNYVGCDDTEAFRRITGLALRKDRKKFVFVGNNDCCSIVRERFDGFLAALREYDLEPVAVLNSGLLAADGIGALEKLAADRIEFDALATVNAGIGEAIMLNLPRFNWRVPEHFSFYSGGAIPGFEDAVPLSTYYSPYRQMGKVAMEMLIDMIEERRDPAAVEQCKLPANYVDFQTI